MLDCRFVAAVLLVNALAGIAIQLNGQSICEVRDGAIYTDVLANLNKDGFRFSLDLYKRARSVDFQKNVIFSPSSIMINLGMLMAGAKAESQLELKNAILENLSEADYYESVNWVQSILNWPENAQLLRSPNAMFTRNDITILTNYTNIITRCFDAMVEQKDFQTQPNQARQEINTWVENETRGRITNLLPESAVDSLTSVILVNVIYFKAEWQKPFNEGGQTFTADFFPLNSPNAGKLVKMMSRKTLYFYKEDTVDDVQIVGLPYENTDLIMYIILPKSRVGLTRLENDMTPQVLESLITGTQSIYGEVTIPKFEIEQSLPMKRMLTDMGVRSIFEQNSADLSGITGENNLFVSDVFHKAFISVNEKGTEAAAATSSVISIRAHFRERFVFKADHAFLFIIRHQAAETTLFMGAVVDMPAYE